MKKRIRCLKISFIIALAALILTFVSCSDENDNTNASQPLVSLSVDTSRYVEKGFLDISLTNNSPIELSTSNDWYCKLYRFDNGQWVCYPNRKNVQEVDITTTVAPAETLNFSHHIEFWQITLEDEADMPAGKYMMIFSFYGLDISYNVAENTPTPYIATAVFELPERAAE